jgi:hypothetical protein
MNVNKEIQFGYSLCEANSTGMRYAILDSRGNIRTKLFRCKDYMQDVYWSEILNKDVVEQYGFKWDGKNTNPVSKQTFVDILMTPCSESTDSLQEYTDNLKLLLNTLEKALNFELRSYVTKCSNDDKDIIISYTNEWSKRPYLISLLFLLMRIGIYYDKDDNLQNVIDFLYSAELKNKMFSNDSSQMLNIRSKKKLEEIFINNNLIEQNWSDYTSSSAVHNNSGIVSYKLLKQENVCQT